MRYQLESWAPRQLAGPSVALGLLADSRNYVVPSVFMSFTCAQGKDLSQRPFASSDDFPGMEPTVCLSGRHEPSSRHQHQDHLKEIDTQALCTGPNWSIKFHSFICITQTQSSFILSTHNVMLNKDHVKGYFSVMTLQTYANALILIYSKHETVFPG